jgi:hypothetical protein
MNERSETKAEELIEARRFYRDRTLSPAINRLMRMSDAELTNVETPEEELARRQARQRGCTCYPVGFISWSKEIKAEQKRLHIAAGRHAMSCPMWVDPSPMYSRAGDSPPSYTLQQERADAEAESLDRRGTNAFGRFSQADRG